jgi:ParB/RepB/Spo0J family partition protein
MAPVKQGQLRLLNVTDILPSKLVKQERDRSALAASVKAHGVLQNIMVRPAPKRRGKFELVFGAGRWKEAKRNGQKQIYAIVRECNDKELLLYNAMENFSRSNLSEIQEGELFKRLQDAGYSTRDLEAELGISDSQISNRIKLVKVLPEKAKRAIENHTVAPSTFEYVTSSVKDAETQAKVIEVVVEKKLDLDSTIQLVKGVQPTSEVYENSPEEYKKPKEALVQPEDFTFVIEVEHGVVVRDVMNGSVLVRDSVNHRDRDLVEELQKAWLKLQPTDNVQFTFRHTAKAGAYNVSSTEAT